MNRGGHKWDVAPLALIAGLCLLSVAWAFGNAPFSAPDEAHHFLRSVGVGQGHIIGTKEPYPPEGLTPVQYAWVDQSARAVDVPRGLDPANSDCTGADPEVSAVCVSNAPLPEAGERIVAVGNYQPLPYVLPGLAILRAHRAVPALFLGRMASLIETVPFLLAGSLALTYRRRNSAVSLAGVGLAVTPTVLFLVSSLSPSGMEVAGGFALAAGLFRLSEEPSAPVWTLVGVSGFALALSRSTGAVWVAALGALFIAWNGPRRSVELVRESRRAAVLTAFALAAGVLLNRWWEARFGSHVAGHVPTVSEAWSATRVFVPLISREAIGVFGYLNVTMPAAAYWIWEAMVLGVVAGGVFFAKRFRKVTIVATAVGLGLLPTFLWFFVTQRTGFPVQARHVLPVLVVLPVLATEAIRRSTNRVTRWVPLLLVPVAAIDALAWWTNARRAAVGRAGPRMFFLRAEWTPPMGWYPWLVVALVGTVLIAGAGIMAVRSPTAID